MKKIPSEREKTGEINYGMKNAAKGGGREDRFARKTNHQPKKKKTHRRIPLPGKGK